MTTTPPAIGSIRLSDAAAPALGTGEYRLTSALDVERKSPGNVISPLAAPPVRATHLEVTGPRYTLGPAEIAERHPPPDARGAFGDRLPHVALGRRTLPWERVAADGMPWLAVLVFAESEIDLVQGTLRALLPATVVTALDALDPIDDDPPVTVVRARDLAAFRAVLPTRKEVKLLAHVRQVNLADSALAGRDDDGVFAVVAANRLPLASTTEGTRYVACLVSLEGRADAWTVAAGQPVPALVVLHSWSFTSTGAGGTFEYRAANLDAAPFGAPGAATPAVVDADGATVVQRFERLGHSVDARYRGPLLGVARGRAAAGEVEDISLTAAFELGRLLGASDGRFLRELVGCHRAADSAARASAVGALLTAAVAPLAERKFLGRAAADGESPAAETITSAALRESLAARVRAIGSKPVGARRVHPAVGAAQTPAPSAPRRRRGGRKGGGR